MNHVDFDKLSGEKKILEINWSLVSLSFFNFLVLVIIAMKMVLFG